ncbi:hypothetical protein KJ632_04125 [Patescibacteria group bacterium]|nr:hypothetical protein [Patescibacteria group bacterium]
MEDYYNKITEKVLLEFKEIESESMSESFRDDVASFSNRIDKFWLKSRIGDLGSNGVHGDIVQIMMNLTEDIREVAPCEILAFDWFLHMELLHKTTGKSVFPMVRRIWKEMSDR